MWETIKEIGRGNQGKVEEVHRGTVVAVRKTVASDEASQERLRREAIALRRVKEGVPEVLDSGDGWLVMSHAPGSSLQGVRLGEGEAHRVLLATLVVIARLHHLRMAHRDLKPSHIFWDGQQVTIIDLGLVAGEWGQDLTGNFVPCSLHWLRPQMMTNKNPVIADHQQSDLYAMGLVFHYLLTGENPEAGETVSDCVYAKKRVLENGCKFSPSVKGFSLKVMEILCGGEASAAELVRLLRRYQSFQRRLPEETFLAAGLPAGIGLAGLFVVLLSFAPWRSPPVEASIRVKPPDRSSMVHGAGNDDVPWCQAWKLGCPPLQLRDWLVEAESSQVLVPEPVEDEHEEKPILKTAAVQKKTVPPSGSQRPVQKEPTSVGDGRPEPPCEFTEEEVAKLGGVKPSTVQALSSPDPDIRAEAERVVCCKLGRGGC